MDEAAYIASVRQILDTLTSGARNQIERCFNRIPAEALSASFEIFVDQDGEGFLDIRVSLDGPDLFVLNRSIEEFSEIVTTKMGSDGLVPSFPLMDPFEDTGFSVHDTLTDIAADWIQQLLRGGLSSPLPTSIESPEGYGKSLPIKLA